LPIFLPRAGRLLATGLLLLAMLLPVFAIGCSARLLPALQLLG